MKYLHRVDFNLFPKGEFHSQFIGFWQTGVESSVVILSRVPPGTGTSIGLHTHQVDQFYYTISGAMTAQLGDTVHRIESGTLVHIPANLPHWNWNEGTEDEVHLEIVVPSPMGMDNFGAPLAELPGAEVLARLQAGSVRKTELPLCNSEISFSKTAIARQEHGSAHIDIDVIQVAAGGEGPALHAHPFDQFYYVIEGELTVQIGFETYQAGPHCLVIVPAGMPHRQWNAGSESVHQVMLSVANPGFERLQIVPVTL